MTIDGYWGSDTTRAIQGFFSLAQTGQIYHQWAPNIAANPALTSGWNCDDTLMGDPTIRHLQSFLGVEADGIMGSGTIRALQDHFGTYADGVLEAGSVTVQILQSRLNAGTLQEGGPIGATYH